MSEGPLPLIYRGSVKDLKGPITVEGKAAVVFEYTDAYSVFDWGRMPDLLPRKGEALAMIAAHWFEKLASAETWREFSKTSEALALRKGNRFGSAFNEIGEELQRSGLATHFLRAEFPRRLVVRQVSVVRPVTSTVLGKSLSDYYPTRNAPAPRLVPLEVVFRFSAPPGSSFLERTQVEPGTKWDFPVLELFTKLESTDRLVSLSEALAISGLEAGQLQTLLLKTAWVAAWLKWACARVGLECADGKLEWGISENGECFLVDAIGPDELRLLKGDVQISKEFLRAYYRATSWYEAVKRAKSEGGSDWKRLVQEAPPSLPERERELATQVYLSLANALTGKMCFPEAWPLDRVIQKVRGT